MDYRFETVSNFTYRGSECNTSNIVLKAIKNRRAAANENYY